MKSQETKRLFSVNTILALAFVSIVGLSILFPNNQALLDLIEESSTADISLAFLKALHMQDEASLEIDISMAKNYAAKAEFSEVIELLDKVFANSKYKHDNEVVTLYIDTLSKHNNSLNGSLNNVVLEKLAYFQSTLSYQLDLKTALVLANHARSLGRPDISLNLLTPHAALSGEASFTTLISLALESNLLSQAQYFAKTLFAKEQTLANAKLYLAILSNANQSKEIGDFLETYHGDLLNDAEFLMTAAQYAEKSAYLDLALSFSDALIAMQPNAANYEYASTLSLAANNLPRAAKYQSKALELKPSADGYLQLNKIYSWLGEILQAQRSSLQSIALNPTQEAVRKGISESRALGDIGTEASLYVLLGQNHWLIEDEFKHWIDAIEKGLGSPEATEQILALLNNDWPEHPVLLGELGRLYSYADKHDLVVATLGQLAKQQSLSYKQAYRMAHAYVMLDNIKLAFDGLKNVSNWSKGPEEFLELFSRLAYDNGERSLALQAFKRLRNTNSEAFDLYRYIRLLLPVDSTNVEEILALYNEYQDEHLHMQLLSYAFKNNDVDLIDNLIASTLDNPQYAQNTSILMWQAKYYESKQQGDKARQILLQLLAIDPENTFVLNNLIWFALDNKEDTFLRNLYAHFKRYNTDKPESWLAMASMSDYLGESQDALLWYQKVLSADPSLSGKLNKPAQITLDAQKSTVSVLLNYASLLDRTGNKPKAHLIRRYLLTHKSQVLQVTPSGELSYRSLIDTFISPAVAKHMVTQSALHKRGEVAISELYAQNLRDNQAYKILFWQEQKAFAEFQLPDWQQLSLALQTNDIKNVKRLLDKPNNLPIADKYVANQEAGRHYIAWQLGESNLGNSHISENDQSLLRKLHVQQHPIKTHSIGIRKSRNSTWNENRLDLEYYAPYKYGNYRVQGYKKQMALAGRGLSYEQIDETGLKVSYLRQLEDSSWQLKLDYADGIANERFGLSGEYAWMPNDYLSAKLHAGINMPNTQSRLMHIAGKEDSVGFDLSYLPTARENISVSAAVKKLSTRFDEDIAQGWFLNIRATEQLLFDVPAFQVYADINLQGYSHSDNDLATFNRYFTNRRFNSYRVKDFTKKSFQRLSIGQRLSYGEPGTPGKTLPSPNYWLDTSVGYNNSMKEFDLNISAGLGASLLGDDELYFKVDWQSSDRFGEEYLNFSLGYTYGL